MSENDGGELVDARGDDYWRGWNAARDGAYDLSEVRKIACALIPLNPDEAMIDIADMAWTLWRAIKAGQEGKP